MLENHQFIFSDEWRYRIRRHFIFWFLWWFYYALLHAANPFGSPEISYFRNPVFTFSESVFFILAQIPLVYTMLYWVLPRFMLRKRYLAAFLVTAVIWFLGGIWHWYLFVQVHPKVLAFLLPAKYLLNTQRPPSATFIMAMMSTYKGAFTVTSIAFVIKFAKHWYLKEQRYLQLQKEKSDAQLQLLTAQIHPHFLFNTLNNIFSQTQTESPRGSSMIMGLSDILRYILYEGNKPLVPLQLELDMVREYIALERLRYGNKLEVHMHFPPNTNDIYIAPLLLLPFIENCFKHGTSRVLRQPWINLAIDLKDTQLVMKLMNGKPPVKETVSGSSGIGINNVRQRLELLYRNDYEMDIHEDEEVFVVDLKVRLTKMAPEATIIASPQTEAVYA